MTDLVERLEGAAAGSREPLIATTDQLGNDLYWKFYAGSDGFIRWTGYDDDNWWDKVSKDPNARTRIGKDTGRSFVIDFDTSEVTIIRAHAEQVQG